jgi:hypothetical protein
MGLRNMKYRASITGGSLTLEGGGSGALERKAPSGPGVNGVFTDIFSLFKRQAA